MLRNITSTCAVGLLALGASLAADRPFEAVMKDTAATNGTLKKNLDAKSYVAAAADAKKMEGLYAEVLKYWKAKKTADAITMSKDGKTASKQLASAAKAAKGEDATKAYQSLLATCKGCHAAHREKGADGKYKIK
jgi:hypothetical protein